MAMVALAPLAPAISRAVLLAGKGSLVRSATRNFVGGAAFQAGAELVFQIAEWARSVDGDWDSEGQQPNDGVPPTDGCWKIDGGAAKYEERESPDEPFATPPGGQCNITSCTVEVVEQIPEAKYQVVRLTRPYTDQEDQTVQIQRSMQWQWRLNPACSGGTCSGDDYPNTGQEPTPPIDLPPIQAGDCIINVRFMGFLGNENGTGAADPVFYLEPGSELRASGGVIVGECNFAPTAVVGGGGDGSGPPHPSLDSLLPGHLSPEID